MIDSKSLFKASSRIFKKMHGSYNKGELTPVRDWLVGLLIFSVIVVIGSIHSAQQFMQYQNISISEGVYEEKIVEYFKPLGDKGIALYETRQETFEELQGSSVPIIPEVEILEVTATSSASTTTPVIEEAPTASSTEEVGVGLAN